MPKPGPDGVDVHAGAKQVDRARMSKTVGANALGRKRRQRPTRLTNGTTNKAINAEARQWFIEAIEEDKLLGSMFSNERLEHLRCAPPNRAETRLVAFANQTHHSRAAPGDIADRQVSSFFGACACVVEEQ